MTETTLATTVRVFVRAECDGFYANSPQIPGLSIWGNSIEQLCERLKQGIKALYRHNRGLDITVVLAADPVTMLPKTLSGPYNDFVLAAAA